jgi:hypothetical protein
MIKLYNPSEKNLTSEDTTYGNENMYYDPETGVTPYSLSSLTNLWDTHSNTAPSVVKTTQPSNTTPTLPYEWESSPPTNPSNNTVFSKTITFFGITLTYAEILIILIIIIVIAYLFLRGK